VGEESDAARAQVLIARATVAEELERLEAAARAAVDIPAKVRRHPVRAAGIAAGAGFFAVGGPRRVLRGARRLVLGPEEPLPKSMLPEEIDKSLRKLGTDGEKVRGTIEREFARYLEQSAPDRRNRDLAGILAVFLSALGRGVMLRGAQRIADQILSPDVEGYRQQLERVRSRTATPPADATATGGAERPPTR
jgi:hypothetical protein